MAAPIPNLRLLNSSPVTRELDLASELFHRINRIIPQEQSLLVIRSDRPVREAVALMREHGYSQIPVVNDGQVLGVFSFRSFAREAASSTLEEWTNQKCAPGDLPVDEFLEEFEFARVTEEMSRVFDAMDRDNGILIGTPERLIGIMTPMDFLRYLYKVASPFVMISEIELALRALIRIAIPSDVLANTARRALANAYGGEDKAPVLLEEMTFDNYQSLVSRNETWNLFEPVFGGTRNRTSAKLKEVGAIRNDLFHFRREITIRDHETLATHRNWLLNKIKQAGSPLKPEELP
jgi:predicted transcriptional regulator